MSFLYFPQNLAETFPNCTFITDYSSLVPSVIPFYPDQYSYLVQWSGNFHTQNSIYSDKQSPTSGITHLKTTDGSSESQVMVETQKNVTIEKNRQKTINLKENTSAKKNSQSNIINHFYSYFSTQERSQALVRKAIHATLPDTPDQQKILLLFYHTIKAINSKRGRKYINKTMILNYFTPDMFSQNLPQIKQQIQNLHYISLDDLCQIFRRACNAFLKLGSVSAILTSKRINVNSKYQHFKKRRTILKAIAGY